MISRLTLLLVVLFLAGVGIIVAAQTQGQPDEYQVKAAFLYNFLKFVEWRPEAFENPGEPIIVCVLGEDPFGRALDDVVAGKKINGRQVSIRRISDPRQAKGCRMLFVSSTEPKSVLPVLASIGESGVLTVGESDSPVSEGMIIDFILDAGKIRFAINNAAAEREKLRLSSRLLSLAILVKK